MAFSPGGTTTTIVHEVEKDEENTQPKVAEEKTRKRLVLKLRPRRHITFTQDTVDNEHMNKKSSKRCCIFHKPRAFGESSSDSDSSDCDDCDSDGDQAPAEEKNPSNNPGAGWGAKKKPRRKKKIPDYQRFHA
mmetsp:Transcript_3213/g.4449  ORF Transcript_3213/g.4449 Transcript_3213/m.4449 type:complete len:133 (-) Transcript_3213:241-639(-)